ncbi:LOW QUALITY PROTEIN: putative Homoserine dehydrogenase [Leishmania naiffi]|uniref:Homoserine dehydrogenase n=1 Tax=Leishmania naiffi TaxID=5678 RepID=A0AAW3CA12_9TRYP
MTANKAMLTRHGAGLLKLAASRTPTSSSFPAMCVCVCVCVCVCGLCGYGGRRRSDHQDTAEFHVQHVPRIEGILSGTSNYALTERRVNPEKAIEEVLRKTPGLGYADADPSNDVFGQDALMKLCVMRPIAFSHQPNRSTLPVAGIDTLTLEMLRDARAKGLRYRHVVRAATSSCAPSATVVREEVQPPTRLLHRHLTCSVKPMLLGPEHPLCHMDGGMSTVPEWTDYLGVLTISGPGAGMYPTAVCHDGGLHTVDGGIPLTLKQSGSPRE